jgi:hypothetical protein
MAVPAKVVAPPFPAGVANVPSTSTRGECSGRIDDKLQPQPIVGEFAGGEAEGGAPAPQADGAVTPEGSGQRVGLGRQADVAEGDVAARRRVAEFQRPVLDRNALEPQLRREGGLGAERHNRAVRAQRQAQPGPLQRRLGEIEFAPQERRDRDLEPQPLGLHVERAALVGEADPLERQIGRRQQPKVDRALDLHRRADEFGQLLLDDGALGAPVDEIGTRQRRREQQDQQDRKDGQAFAQGFGLFRVRP